MKHSILLMTATLLTLCSCKFKNQTNKVENVFKEAPIDVTITNEKQEVLSNLVVIFKSEKSRKVYKHQTDINGKISLALPVADSYEIFIQGFDNSDNNTILEIPALKINEQYKEPFKVDIEYEAPETFILDDCLFEINSHTITESSYENLNSLVRYLTKLKTKNVELIGHADNNEKNKIDLSLNRANTIKEYLLAKGISAERISIKNKVNPDQITKNISELERALNRNTEIFIR